MPTAYKKRLRNMLSKLMWEEESLRHQVTTSLDQQQFAYCPEVGVEDAIIYLLQRAQSHLDKAGSAEQDQVL